jgi:putrescine transport system ATP-binding protein
VANFVGNVNLIEGCVGQVYPGFVTVERNGLRLRISQPEAVAPGMSVWVALRPEKIGIGHDVPQSATGGAAENGASGVVTDIGYLGTLSIYKVRLDDGLVLKAAMMNQNREAARTVHVKDRVWLSWTPAAGVLLIA